MASSFTLIVGLLLLGATAGRVAAALGLSSAPTFLIGSFVIGHAVLLLVALALSLVRGFTATYLLVALVAVCGGTLITTRGSRSGVDWRGVVYTFRSDPILLTLGAIAALGFAYSVAMGIWVPQVEDDVLTYHLVRAPLWWQHHGITYLKGIFDLRNNAYPPGGELGPLSTMTLAGSDYFVALDQMLSALALAVGAAGIARRIGVDRRQAIFGGLLVLTLPLVALQAGTAMSDLIVAAFLLSAALLLLDTTRWSPWLAGVAAGLAVNVKLSAPFGLPLLFVIGWFARPLTMRRTRLAAIAAGSVLGAFWYVVNLAETGSWEGHVTAEFNVDRSPAAIVARILRIAIEFIDLSGATGRDRWMYAIAALVVLLVAFVGFLRRRRLTVLVAGALAALVALVPVLLLPVERGLIRGYFKGWDLLGRRDLANLDSGRDITKSASNFSWYGPLGSVLLVAAAVIAIIAVRRRALDRLAIVFVLAPLYWLVAFAGLLFYQDWVGRFFAFPIVLTAGTWGLVMRWRPIAWGVTAIAGTTVLLALANDAKRPSGLPLLEGHKPRSVWNTPRWTGVALRRDYDQPIRFLDNQIPASADVGLAITPSDPVYPFFGRGLERHVRFVQPGDSDAPAGVRWVFVRPDHQVALCDAWKMVLKTSEGWKILRRIPGKTCSPRA